jgi:hypothetical protein
MSGSVFVASCNGCGWSTCNRFRIGHSCVFHTCHGTFAEIPASAPSSGVGGDASADLINKEPIAPVSFPPAEGET